MGDSHDVPLRERVHGLLDELYDLAAMGRLFLETALEQQADDHDVVVHDPLADVAGMPASAVDGIWCGECGSTTLQLSCATCRRRAARIEADVAATVERHYIEQATAHPADVAPAPIHPADRRPGA